MWLLFIRNKCVECINTIYSVITNIKFHESIKSILKFILISIIFCLCIVGFISLLLGIWYGFGSLTNVIFDLNRNITFDECVYYGIISSLLFMIFCLITYFGYKFVFFIKKIFINNYKLAKNNIKVKFIWKS